MADGRRYRWRLLRAAADRLRAECAALLRLVDEFEKTDSDSPMQVQRTNASGLHRVVTPPPEKKP